MLVDECSDERIPQYIDESDNKEHERCRLRIDAKDIRIEQQQIHADGLIDKVLCQVARAEAYALHPVQMVETTLFVSCSHILIVVFPTKPLQMGGCLIAKDR